MKKPRVLLVDFDAGRQTAEFLRANGFAVQLLKSYRRFETHLQMSGKPSYNVLLLEICCDPHANGKQDLEQAEFGRSTGVVALKAAKEKGLSVPPVVLLTFVAFAEAFYGESLRSYFPNLQILTKPVDGAKLLQALRAAAGY